MTTKSGAAAVAAVAGGGKRSSRPGVDHSYHDYATIDEGTLNLMFPSSNLGGMRQHNPLACGVQQQGFAVKLHYMLTDVTDSGKASIVSWQPHGRCFVVHDRKAFVEQILPCYFLQSTFASFQRQLNLYGFKRISSSQDKGGYYHELFLRSKPDLACYIQRIKRKGSGPRKPDSPESEPNFYAMPYLPNRPTPKVPAGGTLMTSCMSFQTQAMNPAPHDQKPAAVKVLNLRSMLPAALLGASPSSPGGNRQAQSMPPYYGYLSQPQLVQPPKAALPPQAEDPTVKSVPRPHPVPIAPAGFSSFMSEWEQRLSSTNPAAPAVAPAPAAVYMNNNWEQQGPAQTTTAAAPAAPDVVTHYQGSYAAPNATSYSSGNVGAMVPVSASSHAASGIPACFSYNDKNRGANVASRRVSANVPSSSNNVEFDRSGGSGYVTPSLARDASVGSAPPRSSNRSPRGDDSGGNVPSQGSSLRIQSTIATRREAYEQTGSRTPTTVAEPRPEHSHNANGNGYPAPVAPGSGVSTPLQGNISANADSTRNVGRPMPLMPLVPTQEAISKKTVGVVSGSDLGTASPSLMPRKGFFVPYAQNDTGLPTETTLSRNSSGSGSLSPTSWTNAFGEQEDFWYKFG